ncbi:hypothetical protein Nmel_018300, partial [Mimus melanotis]
NWGALVGTGGHRGSQGDSDGLGALGDTGIAGTYWESREELGVKGGTGSHGSDTDEGVIRTSGRCWEHWEVLGGTGRNWESRGPLGDTGSHGGYWDPPGGARRHGGTLGVLGSPYWEASQS